ncbi:MAG: HD-GYP domain-containing protein, partial [Candidatus Bipolaricaulota bacterium]
MDTPSFIHKKEEYLNRVAKTNTDIRLLARHDSLEVMKQKISEGSNFYLDSAEEWQGFEFVYLLEGKMEYTGAEPPVTIEAGDYISREGVPEKSWFETKTEVTVLYTSTQPAFYLLRQEIEDYLQLAEEIESTERMGGHSKRLVRMSQKVGEILGLSADRLSDLRYASFFHDLGKARVPDKILEKEGKLTPDEWKIMEKHTIWGREMLEGTEHLGRVGEIVEQSHERVDGRGYPKGLEGEEISLEARIIAVVDAWDAMRSDRPYRDALPREVAVAELRDNKGSQFDPEVVGAFLDILEDRQVPTSTYKTSGKYRGEPTWLRQREKLLELSRQVLEPEGTDVIMAKTLEAVIEATPFQRAVISVFDRPIDLENPEPARVNTYAYRGLTEEQEDRIEGGQMEGVQVNLDKFDSRYQLGNSFYVPHDERRKNLESSSVIESQLREEETLDWHPDDSLYIPLYKDDKIVGQISVDDPNDGLVPDPESLRPIE